MTVCTVREKTILISYYKTIINVCIVTVFLSIIFNHLSSSKVQPVRVVRCPSLQPGIGCGGEQLHPPQQLLVWSRLPDATR